jgi:hypothetical protein
LAAIVPDERRRHGIDGVPHQLGSANNCVDTFDNFPELHERNQGPALDYFLRPDNRLKDVVTKSKIDRDFMVLNNLVGETLQEVGNGQRLKLWIVWIVIYRASPNIA